MNNKTLILILVGTAIIFGLIYYRNYFKSAGNQAVYPSAQKSTASKPAYYAKKSYIIEIYDGDKGFQPNKLDIHSGDRVVFLNQGLHPHWPIYSDPSNKICPDLNSFHGLVPSEKYVYTFKFAAPYSCPFTDMLEPSITGVINVVK